MQLNQITLPALDVEVARDFYLKLGFTLIVDGAPYIRLQAPQGGTTLSIQQVEALPQGPCPKIYLECKSAAALDQKVKALKAMGITFDSAPTDQRWLWREAWLHDPAGNKICLYYASENRLNPPWRVP
jgi:catechol 2,3-dioxygenase-like lactoylglutathione lyase family enzyme